MTGLDPAAIMLAHDPQDKGSEGSWCDWCAYYSEVACEVYRLAEALAVEQIKVARLEGGIKRAVALATNPTVDHGARAVAMRHELVALADGPTCSVCGSPNLDQTDHCQDCPGPIDGRPTVMADLRENEGDEANFGKTPAVAAHEHATTCDYLRGFQRRVCTCDPFGRSADL